MECTLEGTLSKALQKYYTREGNRIIFSNGMTLNQLAWEMWERLGYQGVDPSVLSRVLKAERLFTTKQFETFCETLDLSSLEKSQLKQALYRDLSAKFGIKEGFFEEGRRYFIDLVEDNLNKIKQVREKDSLDLAAQWIGQIWERSIKELPKTRSFRRNKLLNLLSQILIERKRTLFVTFKTDSLPQDFLELPVHLIHIGEEIRNNEVLGVGYAALANILVHNRKYEDSIRANKIAIDLLGDETEKAVSLSRIGIAFAKLGKEKDYLNVKRNLNKQLRLYSDDTKCYVMQAMAQAEAYLGLFSVAEKSLSSGWDIYFQELAQSQSYVQTRRLQLIRSEILRLSLMSGYRQRSKMQDWVEQGVVLAQSMGLKVRHEDDVTKLSNTVW